MGSIRLLARRLALLLDREGTRWLLSMLLPLAGKLSPVGVRRLRFDRAWIHRFDAVYVVEPVPRLKYSELREESYRAAWGFLYMPKAGDTVVDVGAGLGAETLFCAIKVGSSGRVIAIEAHPLICECLKRSTELNGFANVKVLNLAVADKPQTVLIENNMKAHNGNAIMQDGGELPVEALPLDQICESERISRIDFLKMNIEGAERLAVTGMDKTLDLTAVLCICCHDFKFARTGKEFFRSKARVATFLRDRGFVLIPRERSVPHISDQINAFNPRLISKHDLKGVVCAVPEQGLQVLTF